MRRMDLNAIALVIQRGNHFFLKLLNSSLFAFGKAGAQTVVSMEAIQVSVNLQGSKSGY